MSENCLYLSIWSPVIEPEELTSVIVILNSGRMEGNISGVELAAIGNVVVVTVESRHGALGFLATSDHIVTGNLKFHLGEISYSLPCSQHWIVRSDIGIEMDSGKY